MQNYNAQSRSLLGAALVVEDDNEMRTLLKSLLIALGVPEVSAVPGLHDAHRLLEYKTFSCAVVDLHLSDGNGAALIKSIRSDPRSDINSMPIVVVSAGSTGTRIQDSIRAGADAFLGKPFTISNLQRQLRFAFEHALLRGQRRLGPSQNSAVLRDCFEID